MKVMFASMDLNSHTCEHYFWGRYLLIPSCSFLLLSFCFLDVAVSVSIEKFLEVFYLLA